jgi:hypothetical protein
LNASFGGKPLQSGERAPQQAVLITQPNGDPIAAAHQEERHGTERHSIRWAIVGRGCDVCCRRPGIVYGDRPPRNEVHSAAIELQHPGADIGTLGQDDVVQWTGAKCVPARSQEHEASHRQPAVVAAQIHVATISPRLELLWITLLREQHLVGNYQANTNESGESSCDSHRIGIRYRLR